MKEFLFSVEYGDREKARSDYYKSFRDHTMQPGTVHRCLATRHNYLVFVVEGKLEVTCGGTSIVVSAGNLFLLPQYSNVRLISGMVPCRLLVCLLVLSPEATDKFDIRTLGRVCEKIDYRFGILPTRPNVLTFVDATLAYLVNDIDNEMILQCRQNELFVMMKLCYSIDELAALFYPLINRSLGFRMFVWKNYRNAESVEKLAEMMGVSRTHFNRLFKLEFGMPPHQWIQNHIAMDVKRNLLKPGVRIHEVIDKFGFNSQTHFTRFCKQQLGLTPRQIISQSKA